MKSLLMQKMPMHGGALRAKEVVGAKWASITRVDNLTLWWTMQYLKYYLSICLQYFLIQMVDNVPLWWTVRYQPSAKFFDATVDTA